MNDDTAVRNQRISDNIREHGWHCLHVFPTKDGQDAFSYSIGFSESYSAPEVLIFGLEQEKAHALLNKCAILLKDGHQIVPDTEDDNILSGDYKVVFRRIRTGSFGEYLGTAMRYYKDRHFSAVAMFLPDRQHRFPWQSGYDGLPADEPLSMIE